MNYKGLPLFQVDFDDDWSVFDNVALVTAPAIQETFIQLSADDVQVEMKIDEEHRIVSGPALIPDRPIYRDMGNRKFYITYSKETIEKMALNFFKNHRNTEGNVEHQMPVNGITFFESYLLNKDRGVAPKEFENLPDGTWILSAKVDNDDVWNLVKEGMLTGFSIAIHGVSLKEEKEIDSLEEFLEYLKDKQ